MNEEKLLFSEASKEVEVHRTTEVTFANYFSVAVAVGEVHPPQIHVDGYETDPKADISDSGEEDRRPIKGSLLVHTH